MEEKFGLERHTKSHVQVFENGRNNLNVIGKEESTR